MDFYYSNFSLLSSVSGSVTRFVFAMILLVFLFMILRVMWIVRQREKYSGKNNKKDIYTVSVEADNPLGRRLSSRCDKTSPVHAGKEQRESPRYNIQCQVEFIADDRLFKEASRDLSYTGIFLKSKKPDRYDMGGSVMLTFQLPKENPQKRNGFIVRKDKSGIGIRFAH